jgi:hypothetical protein
VCDDFNVLKLWYFLDFRYLQLNFDWQKNFKTKVEQAFFFIFMSSYAEMRCLGPKKLKRH